MKLTFFKSQADFRKWLATHHASDRELWIGFYKKASGKGGLEYKEAVDQALCFGWIDGIKKRVDQDAYTHRFTPRTASSGWSAVNTRRIAELIAAKRVTPPGLKAFRERNL